MNEFVPEKKLPVSAKSFAQFIKQNLLYIDKTEYIYLLAKDFQPRFLSRPRRFGKSTLVSTLKELFEHGTKPYDEHPSLFKGLKIEKLWTDPKVYPVIHLDFSNIIGESTTVSDFQLNFSQLMSHYARILQVDLPPEATTGFKKFECILQTVSDNSLVVLIDEYDAPVIYFLNRVSQQEYESLIATLRAVYRAIKNYGEKLRFTFITGITRYKDVYLLTEGNSIIDISLDPRFSAICGYTREEIREGFNDYLVQAAMQWFNLTYAEATASPLYVEKVLDEMACWYDGYCFDDECSMRVFSTWSVLKFFESGRYMLDTYWYNTAGLPSLIIKALFKSDYDAVIEKLDNNKEIVISKESFINPSSLDRMKSSVLLYQTGYLTLGRPFAGHRNTAEISRSWVTLKFPNFELRQAFFNGLSEVLLSRHDAPGISEDGEKLQEAIRQRNTEQFMEILNLYFRDLDHEAEPISSEGTFSAILYIFLKNLLCIQVISNKHQFSGKPDLSFECAGTTVIIENKFVPRMSDASKRESALRKAGFAASEQIHARKYGETASSQSSLWRLGIVYDGFAREIACCTDADKPYSA